MTRKTSLRIRRLPVLSLLALSAVAAYSQTPSALSGAVPTSALLATTAHELATTTGLQAAEEPSAVPNTPEEDPLVGSAPASSLAELPNAPSSLDATVSSSSFDLFAPSQATPNVAPRLTKYIPSGWTAQSITGRDKFLIGLRDLYSPLDFVAMIASAGYGHVLNGEPNYGTDRGAFGQRLGAAAIRESTQGFFTDSVFSPLLHEDPRYYVQGSGHNFFYRAAYAATRPFITKTDNGDSTVNGALLLGYASSAAVSYTYYPQINKNFHDTASTFGSSLGGAALGYVVSEFSDDLLKAVHLRKK